MLRIVEENELQSLQQKQPHQAAIHSDSEKFPMQCVMLLLKRTH